MERGFRMDTSECITSQQVWIPGEPPQRTFLPLGELKGRPRLRVVSLRCPSCGLLEDYAQEPR